MLSFSVIIPCFNQGRFLTECLESLASQSVLPDEVIVVNDGSIDEQTNMLFGRLPCYHYPFQLRVLHKQNGGVESARNHGIAHSTGDIVLPLDADDKVTPDALQCFREAFERQPAVDAFYPDVYFFGQESWSQEQPGFNAWRLVGDNWMVCSTAMRRKIFDAGYWFDERMRQQAEDWELWLRAFVLGPFKAAPLKQVVFGYRKMGYSAISAVDRAAALAKMRAFHAEAGIWCAARERQLRKAHAPTHCLVSPRAELFADADDLLAVPENELGNVLANNVSRLLWFGSAPPEAMPGLQLILGEVARRQPAPAYVFHRGENDRPFLIVLDRQWVMTHPAAWESPLRDVSEVVEIRCREGRFPGVHTVSRRRRLRAADLALLGSLATAWVGQVLPPIGATSERDRVDLRFLLARQPAIPRFLAATAQERVLAVFLPDGEDDRSSLPLRQLLSTMSVRKHFDKILAIRSADGRSDLSSSYDDHVDGCVDLGNLSLDLARKAELVLNILETARVRSLLIAGSAFGYELTPFIRKARLPIRINALIHEPALDPHGMEPAIDPMPLPTAYANLLDRVASFSRALTVRMVDEWYFPPAKIRTVKMDSGPCEDAAGASAGDFPEAAAWLFDETAQTPRAEFASVFGAGQAA